jgi:hypothetical protein
MRIAFVSPPALPDGKLVEAEDCCWGAKSVNVLPGMLIACATEALNAGHNIAFIDLGIDQVSELRKFGAELVIYPLAWQYHRLVEEMMGAICGSTKRMILSIPAGYARDYATLPSPPFAALYSEPEMIVRGLPASASDLPAWRSIAAGIMYLDGYQVRMSPSLPTCMDLLAPVNWDVVPRKYWKRYTVAVYQVTRGCPYRCKFCVWGGSTVTDRTFKMRPAKQVAGDLRRLNPLFVNRGSKRGSLYLLSAQLTTSMLWLREFAEFMGNDPIPYQSNVNLREMTDEKANLLYKSGMRQASAGLEAFTDRMLKRMGKPWTAEEALEGALILERSEIPTVGMHIRTGYGETAEEIDEAIEAATHWHEAGIGRINFNFGPIAHYDGTLMRDDHDYLLVDAGTPGAPVYRMKDIPSMAWRKFVEVTREFGWYASKGIAPLGVPK